MAAKPLDLDDNEDLESAPDDEAMEGEDSPDMPEDSGVDPMFAADIAEAFPDLEDSQIAAIQRAVLGLLAGGGGGMGGPPSIPPPF